MNHLFHHHHTAPAVQAQNFRDLLDQVAAAHSNDLESLHKEYDEKIKHLKDEVAGLRARLSEVGISPDDVGFDISNDGNDEDADKPAEQAAPEGDQAGRFEIKKEWTKKLESNMWGQTLDSLMLKYKRRVVDPNNTTTEHLHPDDLQGHHHKHHMMAKSPTVVNPTSNFRLGWDIMGLILIGWDLFTIPFVQAFQPTPSWFTELMDWWALLFWSGDMLQGFFLGYYEKGHYVVDNWKIIFHYLKTWFVVDAIVVGPEWVMLIAGSLASSEGNQVNAFAKFFKGARAIRVLRLLRLLKLQRIMNLLYDMIESEWTFIVLNLSKMLLFVVVLNHVIACLWYLIGRVNMEYNNRNWIMVGGVNGTELAYSYTTSLHWSLTQFTPASMDISARNTWERIFSIIVLFFALVTFSSIVASITGSTTSLRNMKTDEMKQFWLLRRYLRQRNVSNDLSNRIFKFLEHQLKIQSKMVQRDNIKILSGLSEALQNEMTHQMHSPHLLEHPFFHHIDTNMKVVIWRICRYVLKPQTFAEKESVFSWGDVAKKMYFVKGGELMYTLMDGSLMYPKPKEWISEAVLWTNWRHQGDLVADDTSELLTLQPASFLEVMSVHPRPWFFAHHYALAFIRMLNRFDRLSLTDIVRDMPFYEDAVRESENKFLHEERKISRIMDKTLLARGSAVNGAETPGEEGAFREDGGFADDDEGALPAPETKEHRERIWSSEEDHPKKPERGLFRFCPCSKVSPPHPCFP